MAFDLIAELDRLVDAFDVSGVEYALCGGLAVAIHGHPRATMDIDILVVAAGLPAALEAARGLGFDIPARGLASGAVREVQRVSKLEAATGALLSIDLIVAGASLEAVWSSRVVLSWNGHAVTIVSREGLVAMKRLAGRPQDLADIAALETPDDNET